MAQDHWGGMWTRTLPPSLWRRDPFLVRQQGNPRMRVIVHATDPEDAWHKATLELGYFPRAEAMIERLPPSGERGRRAGPWASDRKQREEEQRRRAALEELQRSEDLTMLARAPRGVLDDADRARLLVGLWRPKFRVGLAARGRRGVADDVRARWRLQQESQLRAQFPEIPAGRRPLVWMGQQAMRYESSSRFTLGEATPAAIIQTYLRHRRSILADLKARGRQARGRRGLMDDSRRAQLRPIVKRAVRAELPRAVVEDWSDGVVVRVAGSPASNAEWQALVRHVQDATGGVNFERNAGMYWSSVRFW